MCSNYPGIKLESALLKNTRRQNSTFVIMSSRHPHNCKKGHFTLRKEQEHLWQKWNVHMQSAQNYCFSFHFQIRKFVTFRLRSLLWLLKLTSICFTLLQTKQSPHCFWQTVYSLIFKLIGYVFCFSLHWQKKMFVFKKTFFPQGISWCRGTKMATWTSCENQGYKCQSTEFRQLDSGSTLFDSESPEMLKN